MHIIVFIIILAILVLIHELGHFLAAKKNGIKVEEFGFGFPPRIWGFRKGETLYSINLLPIGGFVKLYGEEYHEEKRGRSLPESSRAFINKSPLQKIAVVVAGVVGNFLLAWVLISYLFTQGVPTPTQNVIVETIAQGSPAASVGLRAGDIIQQLSVGDTSVEIHSTKELISYSKQYAGKQVIVLVQRGGSKIELAMTPRLQPPSGQGPLGISVTSYELKKYPWYTAPFFGLVHAVTITKQIVIELASTAVRFFSFQNVQVDVAGPVGIAQYTGQAIKFGKNAVLELMALLSLNLAIINILPFPALDGGRLVFILYEMIAKRPVNRKVEQYVNIFGMLTLLALAAVITVHDVLKLIH